MIVLNTSILNNIRETLQNRNNWTKLKCQQLWKNVFKKIKTCRAFTRTNLSTPLDCDLKIVKIATFACLQEEILVCCNVGTPAKCTQYVVHCNVSSDLHYQIFANLRLKVPNGIVEIGEYNINNCCDLKKKYNSDYNG